MIGITNTSVKTFTFAAMIKQTAAIFLFFAFAVQTFSSGFVMLNYYTDTTAFAKNCENKARPKLHCNGKCQMMKKLKEEEKKDEQVPERKFENKIEVLSSKSFFYNIETAFTVTISKATAFEINYPLKDISFSFFRPPQA